MAYLTRSEFAERCGLPKKTARAYISQNIKRGKIIPTSDGKLIDDTIPQNIEFLQKEIEKNSAKVLEKEPKAPILRMIRPDPDFSKIQDDIEDLDLSADEQDEIDSNTPLSALDKKYKLALLKKVKVDTRINEHKEAKLKGDVIPIDLARIIVAQLSQSFVTEFKNTAEDILTLFSKRKQMNTNEIAEIRGGLIECINSGAESAVKLAQQGISNIADEYAIKRSPGERS